MSKSYKQELQEIAMTALEMKENQEKKRFELVSNYIDSCLRQAAINGKFELKFEFFNDEPFSVEVYDDKTQTKKIITISVTDIIKFADINELEFTTRDNQISEETGLPIQIVVTISFD